MKFFIRLSALIGAIVMAAGVATMFKFVTWEDITAMDFFFNVAGIAVMIITGLALILWWFVQVSD